MVYGAIVWMIAATGVTASVTNGGFDQGLSGWTSSAPALDATTAETNGRTIARIVIPDGTPQGYPNLHQTIEAAPGDLLTVTADARGEHIHDGYGVYMAVEFYDANDNRMSFSQSGATDKDGTWTQLRVQTVVPPGTSETRLCLIVNGGGKAEFDSVTVTREPGVVAAAPPDGPVTITVTDEVACPSLIGFGTEDDGWFYNDENAAHGVRKDDIKLREERITSMDPDWVRMFFWYKDWNPSGDWKTFDFDSPNMRSHYRTLDLYQQLGARVNGVGVEWGVEDPYGDPEAAARAIGALFEYLINDKGYTCVQEWTLTNEPNGYFVHKGYEFERFVQLHLLVRAEFERRGLKVRIVGSDDTNGGFPFFTHCVEDDRYFDAVDYFASHHYFPYADRVTAPAFFDERLDLLAKRKPQKHLIVAEFGFQDARSSALNNPIMESYPYAVWTAAFVIDGLNRGVAGFSIWCLHEVYYPGNGFMNYGLWDYKDNNWKLRPVYYAWQQFTRLTEPGMPVLRCASSSPAHVIAARIGDQVFWVNRSTFPVHVLFEGWNRDRDAIQTQGKGSPDGSTGRLPAFHVEMNTEASIKDGGKPITPPITNRGFEAPPMSFGTARRVSLKAGGSH